MALLTIAGLGFATENIATLKPGEIVVIASLTFDAGKTELNAPIEIFVEELTKEEIGLELHPVYSEATKYYRYGSPVAVDLFYENVIVSVPIPEGIPSTNLRVLFYAPPGSTTESIPEPQRFNLSYDPATDKASFPTNGFTPES